MKYINVGDLMSWIDAQKLLAALDHGEEAVFDTYTKVQRKIASSGVVEVKHGEWETVNEDWDVYECSVCQHEIVLIAGDPKDNRYNFCPNCGADMRGDTE